MPDWFYRTVTQPVLFRLPAERARDFALGFMGRLVRLPFGPAAIDFLGHMGADPRLRRAYLGIDFPSALGLAPGLDGRAVALPALARFGFGFLEVGPISVEGTAAGGPLERYADREAIASPDPPPSLSLEGASQRLAEASRSGLPLIARLGHAAGDPPEKAAEDGRRLVAELAPHVQLFSLAALGLALADAWPSEQWFAYLRSVLAAAQAASPPRPVLLCVPADLEAEASSLVEAALEAGAAGLLIDGSVAGETGIRLIGLPAREPARDQVRRWRSRHGQDHFVIAGGGVHEPADALALLAAGADLVQADSGIVFTGPGLPKRINDALLFAETRAVPRAERPERAPEMTWFWTALLGAGMLFGSLLALAIAATRVVLPYDEAFLGMSRHEIAALNPRLLAFMAHDRVSLAGTMAGIGILYLGLSLFGIRRGLHWAQQSVFVSACTGFASFFLFLGFGYLDPFHAFVTAALLQLLLMGVHSRLGLYTPDLPPSPSDRAWKRGLWGQLLLVVHGVALLGAGAAISGIGITGVFVPEDLEFMRTTAEALTGAHPRLVPLVAHDRATLGGMLLAVGWVFLLPVLWGFRNGSPWLWWSLLLAGLCGYGGALGIHFTVGYTDWLHLFPAFGGLGLLLLGLGLSRSYLCGPRPAEKR